MIDHFEMRTSNSNSKRLDLTDLRCPSCFSELADLGLVRETLIFKTWNLLDLIGQKYISLQGELSNVLRFFKQCREAPRIGSPSFPISFTKMPNTVFVISPKLLLLCV